MDKGFAPCTTAPPIGGGRPVSWARFWRSGSVDSRTGAREYMTWGTCAFNMLRATGDIRKVALWLGHSTTQTAEMFYLQSDPSLRLEALSSMTPPKLRPGKFRPPDRLLELLRERGAGSATSAARRRTPRVENRLLAGSSRTRCTRKSPPSVARMDGRMALRFLRRPLCPDRSEAHVRESPRGHASRRGVQDPGVSVRETPR
jgi:hypothetical protein